MAELQEFSGHLMNPPGQVTACHRCRRHKLRCSKESPRCKRCQDISASCTYPPPPDRKLLAAQRAQIAKQGRESGSGGEVPQHSSLNPSNVNADQPPFLLHESQTFHYSNVDINTRFYSEDSPDASLATVTFIQPHLPTHEIALALIDIYFSYVYNSSLLFHKPTFLSDYKAGKIADFVLLSVLAVATIFLPDPSGHYDDSNNALAGCRRYGDEWARAASQRVLVQADQPRMESIQACQTVALYWFSMGRLNRTNIHTHIAYEQCRILGYHRLHANVPDSDRVYTECKRRCFWSCWITSCISQDNASFKDECWKEAVGLPLPCDEPSYLAGRPRLKETWDSNGNLQPILQGEGTALHTSYMGELVKLFRLWWEIQRFAKRYANAGPLEDALKRMSTLQELDQHLEMVHDKLTPDFQYTGMSSFVSSNIEHSCEIYGLHSLYHLCACTLHSSIVPVFSSIPPDPRISKKLSRLSANEAIKHSKHLMDLATNFLGIYSDKGRFTAITGYAMFFGCSIQFKSLCAQGRLRIEDIGHLYPAISILEQLKEPWQHLKGLWKTLAALFQSVNIDINNLSNTRQLLSLPAPDTNLDQIIAHGVLPRTNESGDNYTYIPDEEQRSSSSPRHSSVAHVQGDSPNAQSPSPKVKQPQAMRPGVKDTPPRSMYTNAPIDMPIHTRHILPTYWSAQEQQQYETEQQYHCNLVGQNATFAPITSAVVGTQGRESIYQTDTIQRADRGVGVEGVDFDTLSAYWWDQSFEQIATDQYGFYYDPGYQAVSGQGYYRM